MRTRNGEDGAAGRQAQRLAISQAMAGQNVPLHRPAPRGPQAEVQAAGTRVLVSATVLLIAVAVLALLVSG